MKQEYSTDDLWYSVQEKHDANMIRFIEIMREKEKDDKDIFFVSTDKGLRFWDMTRVQGTYPVVIYPSQLFLILIKMCGRSANDYESFVSFINIRTHANQLSPDTANIILSGISSITEDIESQKLLVSTVFDKEFQNIIQYSNNDEELYKKTQAISQHYLEIELADHKEKLNTAFEQLQNQGADIANLKSLFEVTKNSLNEKTDKHEKVVLSSEDQQNRIKKFATKKTKPKFIFVWYIIPLTIVLFSIFVFFFIALQFIYCNESWNIITNFFAYIKNTTFGSGVEYVPYVIDAALLTIIGLLYKKVFRNPFNKQKKKEYRHNLIENYIKNNDL